MRLPPVTRHSSIFRVSPRSLFTIVAALVAIGILQLALSGPDSAGAAGSNAPASQLTTGNIAGRVTDQATGNPIVSVRVSANIEPCCGGDSALTDQDGNFEITDLAPGDYRVRVEASTFGFVDEYYDNSIGRSGLTLVSVTTGQTSSAIDFALVQGGSIAGTVFEPGGIVPVEGIWVSAWSETHAEWVSFAATDSAGNYALSGVPEGLNTLDFRDHSGTYAIEYYNDRIGFFAADLIQVTGTQAVTGLVTVLNLAGTMSGTVLAPDGVTPLEDFTVVALDPFTHDWIQSALTDAAGMYTIPGLRSGDYKVWALGSAHDFPDQYFDGETDRDLATTVNVNAPGDTPGIDFVMNASGTITGRLTDNATGDPISGVWVSANLEVCCGGNGATTDQDGNFEITALGPGEYWVRTAASDLGFVDEYYDNSINFGGHTTVLVIADQTSTGIDFALVQGGSISGTVFEPGGVVPLEGIRVNAFSETHETWASGVTTDAAGNYVLRGVPEGQNKVEFADHSGVFANEYYNDQLTFFSADLVQVTGAQVVGGIDAVLDLAGSISGTVFAPDGVTPVQGLTIAMLDPGSGVWVVRDRTDPDGKYFIGGLRSGDYKIWAVGSSHGYVDQYFDGVFDPELANAVRVTAPVETTDIDFVMSTGGTITGRLTDEATGNPIVGVDVVARTEQCCGGNRATTDHDGNYEITALGPGDHWVLTSAFSLGFVDEYYNDSISFSGRTPVSVAFGQTTPDIDFALALGGSIAGAVFEPDGVTPLEGIWINAWSETHSTWLTSSAGTDSSGNYVLTGVPDGQHRVEFIDHSGDYVDEIYNDKHRRSSADLVQVTGTQAVTGIDAVLEIAGTISGTVFAPDGITPVSGLTVAAFDPISHDWLESATTDAAGNYSIRGLGTGDYKIEALGFGQDFADQYFDGTPDFNLADVVSVTAPGDTPGIDFVMALRTSVERSASVDQVHPGDEVEITLTPFGIGDFYAVRENLGGLELVSHTADAFDEGVFVNLTPSPISYVVRVPLNVSNGDQLVISGQFWEDPGDEAAVSPSQTVLNVVVPDTELVRELSASTGVAGDIIDITLTPSGIRQFYAAQENLDGLELVSHDADRLEQGVFVRISNDPIHYQVRIPNGTSQGQFFDISGTFWEDPGRVEQVTPSVSRIAVVNPNASVNRTLSAAGALAGETVTVTITPTDVNQFYAVREELDGLELVSHTADNFSGGAFVQLGPNPFQYTVRVPAGTPAGQLFGISGVFWEDPGQERPVDPANSLLEVTGGPDSSVNRTLSADEVRAGGTVTVTLTPTDVALFYAVREDLGDLELVSHTADDFFDGAFVQLSPNPFEYTVRVPLDAPPGALFSIGGVFWEDPGETRLVDPTLSQINVPARPAASVLRSLDANSAPAGGTVMVTITPSDVELFYAVSEDLGDLELVSHTADGFDNGAFVMLTPDPFEYRVRVPAGTPTGAELPISGTFWEDPGQERPIDPAVSTINVLAGPASFVERTLDATNAAPGGTVTVTLTPSNVELFYAVREDLGDLELVSHTADGFDNGAFVMLTPDPFEYTVRVPVGTPTGTELPISGMFWEDPGQERPVDPSVSTIRVSQGPPLSVERSLSANSVSAGGSVTVTLTPTNIELFYAVREHIGGLELISHTADGFDDGAFIMLTAEPFQYTVRVPHGSHAGAEFGISGTFWENPGFEFDVAPPVSIITVGRPASLERTPGSRSAAPGEEFTLTLTPHGIDLFYAARENLDGLELISHDADNFEDGVFIRLSPTPINYTVRVPIDAPDGTTFDVTGTFWEDPGFKLDTSPAVTQVRVSVNPAVVERTVVTESVVAGALVTVTITPTDVDLFYAVSESLGDLELISHTADGFDDGVFLMLSAQPFEYTVRVPINAADGDQFPISGTFWEDPGFEQPVTPPTTVLFTGPAIGLLFVPDELPLDLNATRTVELHVTDLLGEEVDTVQLKITHDPAVIEISSPSCIGLFADGAPGPVIRDEDAGASWFNCHVLDTISGGSGAVMSFDVTRVGPGNPVLEMVTTGVTRTKFIKGGLVVETSVQPLNTLQILPDTSVSGMVTIQGVAPGDEDAFAVIGPHVSLVPTSGGRETGVDVNPDGAFAIHGVLDGVYDVILDAPGSLGRRLVGLTVAGVDIELQPIQLRGGISNPDDDIVEGQDISAVAGSFGLGPNELNGRFAPGTELIVDFNGDLWVSAFDISIVLSNMGETRLQEWTDPAVVTGG